jgi:hypothetical protein
MVVIWCVSIEFTLFDYAATNADSPQARIADTLTLILRTRLRYNQLRTTGVRPLKVIFSHPRNVNTARRFRRNAKALRPPNTDEMAASSSTVLPITQNGIRVRDSPALSFVASVRGSKFPPDVSSDSYRITT